MNSRIDTVRKGSVPLVEALGIARIDAKRKTKLIAPSHFALRAGERVTISGPSGAGKSVLMRALALLDRVDEGEIRWRGRPIARDDVSHYRRRIAYVRQRPAMIDGSVADNLRMPYQLAAYRDARFDESAASSLLRQAHRDADFLTRSTRDLSGGESQIVALIRVLQLAPDVLLLDEPTAALDPESARAIEGLVSNWFEEGAGKRASVWVSHDPDQAQRVGSVHYTMHAGVLHSPTHTSSFSAHD